jgi:hypothetical protein
MEQQIGNLDFDGDIDYAPKRVEDDQGRRQYTDLMGMAASSMYQLV